MKPLHKITYKDEPRPVFNFIQVKAGKVCVLCPHYLVVLPVEEVFGKDVIAADEELYFEKRLWGSAKFDKAVQITRDGSVFNGIDSKHRTGGTLVALSEKSFADKIGRFPDWPCVVPAPKTPLIQVDKIGFNYKYLYELCSVFALSPTNFKLFFRGTDKAIIVKHVETEGFGLLMPYLCDYDFNYPETDKQPEPETADDLL